MAITRVGVGAQGASATTGASITAAYPAAYTAVANDLAVVVLAGRQSDTSEPTVPTGYTQQATIRRAGQLHRITTYTKVLTAAEAAPSFTVPAAWADGMTVQMAVYRGVNTATPMDATPVTSESAAATDWVPTGITSVTNAAWILSAVSSADDNALALSVGNEQGFSGAMTGANYDTILGTDHAVGLADKEQTTAGAVTMCTWTETAVGTDAWVGITMALRPAGGTVFSQSCAGAVSFAGAVTRTPTKPLAGVASFSGALKRTATKPTAGTVGFVGGLAKTATKVLSGAVTPTGALAAAKAAVKAVAGALSFGGATVPTYIPAPPPVDNSDSDLTRPDRAERPTHLT